MTGLRVAISRAEITPRVGAPLGGYLGRPQFEALGIHDALYAKVLAVEGDGRPVLLYSLDLLGLTADRTARLTERVAVSCGVSPRSIAVACTHNHCGPSTLPLRGIPLVDEGYFDYLGTRMVEAGRQALAGLTQAALFVGTVSSSVGVNRRKPGVGGIQLGENPDGSYDDTLLALRFVDPRGDRTLGVLTAYGCHLTSLGEGPLISAEWAGMAMASLEQDLGCPCMFMNGALGNVSPRGRDSTFVRAALIADRFREDSLRALEVGTTESGLPVGLIHHDISLPLAPLATEEEIAAILASAEKALAADADVDGRIWHVRQQHALAVRRARQNGAGTDDQKATLTGLRIGPVAFLGMPGEVFAEYGPRLRGEAQFRYVVVLSNVGTDVGYLPTQEAFAEGGYEPTSYVYFGVHRFAPGMEEVLVEGARALADRLATL